MKGFLHFKLLLITALLFITQINAFNVVAQVLQDMQQKTSMTNVFLQEGHLSDNYSFHFVGNPVCTFTSNENEINNVKKGEAIHLTFFVSAATLNGKEGKQAFEMINNKECSTDYCVRMSLVDAPVVGIQYDITLNPSERTFEYQAFNSITGERGIVFKFHNQQVLKSLGNNTPSKIRRPV